MTQLNFRLIFDNDTVWLTQKQIAGLFMKDRTVISKHINNVFKEGELDEQLVCKDFLHTTQHSAIQGKTQETIAMYFRK